MTAYMSLISAEAGTFTGIAQETLTAGDFVKAVASDDSVNGATGISTFAGTEILISRCDAGGDEEMCVGIVGEGATSGESVIVYTEGIFIVRAGEAITAGVHLKKADSTDYAEVEMVDANTDPYYDSGSGGKIIGTALTSASAADAYLVMLLRV